MHTTAGIFHPHVILRGSITSASSCPFGACNLHRIAQFPNRPWGDATFVSLFCISGAIFYWPDAYFRGRKAGGSRKRNLAANWTILMVSTGAAAAYAQHESATPGLFHGTRAHARLEIVLATLLFVATFCALWFVYAKVMNRRRLARRKRRAPNAAFR